MTQWTAPKGERRGLVAICCSERMIHRETAISLMNLAWGGQANAAADAHGFAELAFKWYDKGVRVDGLRNQACADVLKHGFTHLLFLDADMTWPVDVLDRLLAHHARGVVSGLYFLRKWPHWPVALKNPKRNSVGRVEYEYDYRAPSTESLRRVDLVGMGCTIIPAALLKRMDRPYFAYQDDEHGQPSITEDVAFCEQAIRLSCPVYLDPALECGHVSTQVITRPWFTRGLMEHQALAQQRQTDGSAA